MTREVVKTEGDYNTETGIVSAAPVLDVGQMLQRVIDKGLTGESVGALEKLIGLYERMDDRRAEREFAAAYVQMQSQMSAIKPTRIVPNNDGTPRYRYAPFDEIMEEVGPRLRANGFSVKFDQNLGDCRITVKCTLLHTGGHYSITEFAVRTGSGPPKATETQADGAATTYAKRGALCAALNIVIDQDNDAQQLGSTITNAEAHALADRVTALGSHIDEKKFLAFAGAPDYASIRSACYPMLLQFLAKKEKLVNENTGL